MTPTLLFVLLGSVLTLIPSVAYADVTYSMKGQELLSLGASIHTTDRYGGEKRTFFVGETIYVHFYASCSGNCSLSNQTRLRIVEVWPDGYAGVAFEDTVKVGQEYIISGTARNPPGMRTLIVQLPASPTEQYWVDKASWQFEVLGGVADIAVTSCWVIPTYPSQEDNVAFNAYISNIGGTDASNVKIDAYVDGRLFSTERETIQAGQSVTWRSNSQWFAEDGPHTLRVVGNSDHSTEESNYANNEATCSFTVVPRTVTATVTLTKTSTRSQTQRTTTATTLSQTRTTVRTTDTTALRTITARALTVTQTLTGFTSFTIYSSTVTVTIASAAQAVTNPLLWLIITAFGIVGATIRLPHSTRVGRYYRRITALSPLPKLACHPSRRDVRKSLFSISIILVAILSIAFQGSPLAYGSTVTSTRTTTSTEWATLTQSLTSTRYVTNTATETSTSMRTNIDVTVTPTVTTIVDRRSIFVMYLATTTTVGFAKTTVTETYMTIVPQTTMTRTVTEILGGRKILEIIQQNSLLIIAILALLTILFAALAFHRRTEPPRQ